MKLLQRSLRFFPIRQSLPLPHSPGFRHCQCTPYSLPGMLIALALAGSVDVLTHKRAISSVPVDMS